MWWILSEYQAKKSETASNKKKFIRWTVVEQLEVVVIGARAKTPATRGSIELARARVMKAFFGPDWRRGRDSHFRIFKIYTWSWGGRSQKGPNTTRSYNNHYQKVMPQILILIRSWYNFRRGGFHSWFNILIPDGGGGARYKSPSLKELVRVFVCGGNGCRLTSSPFSYIK